MRKDTEGYGGRRRDATGQESLHTASSQLTAPGSQFLNARPSARLLALASSSRLSHAGIATYGFIPTHGSGLPAPSCVSVRSPARPGLPVYHRLPIHLYLMIYIYGLDRCSTASSWLKLERERDRAVQSVPRSRFPADPRVALSSQSRGRADQSIPGSRYPISPAVAMSK